MQERATAMDVVEVGRRTFRTMSELLAAAKQTRSSCMDTRMDTRIVSIAAALGLLIGSTAIAYAQNPSRDSAPGQQMQDKGSVPGQPGASGYAPGQQMQDKGSKPGSPGASGYAPGRQDTTGQGGRMDKDTPKSPAR
jgi:hypothetical protein